MGVVKEYTDKIYHFDWINDFSAARNVAMDHARGEWFMYFDDDEYFDDVSEFIDFFKSDECNVYRFGLYYTGDYITPDRYEKGVAGRLIRRTSKTRFVGYVHECFNERYAPTKQFDAFTHHFGYMYENPEQRKAKLDRNMSLMEKELTDHGMDVHICSQIVGQLKGDYPEEANKRCQEYVKALEGTGQLETNCGQWLITALIRFAASWGNLSAVLDIEKEICERYKLCEMARIMLSLKVASVAYENENYAIAAERVKTYFINFDWLEEHPIERANQLTMDFASFIMADNLYMITMIGAVSEFNLGHYEKAYSYIKRLDFRFCNDYEGAKRIIEATLNRLSDKRPLLEYYQGIYKNEFFEDHSLWKYLPETVRIGLIGSDKC